MLKFDEDAHDLELLGNSSLIVWILCTLQNYAVTCVAELRHIVYVNILLTSVLFTAAIAFFAEKLLISTGRELRRALFSLKQIFQVRFMVTSISLIDRINMTVKAKYVLQIHNFCLWVVYTAKAVYGVPVLFITQTSAINCGLVFLLFWINCVSEKSTIWAKTGDDVNRISHVLPEQTPRLCQYCFANRRALMWTLKCT